ncbi:MAG TPA: hypothetical protein VK835_12210 [Bacteroidia bacterium]|jgi:hypothetical protein|nr:hypothetical protein [Bacteroidia bacterium]
MIKTCAYCKEEFDAKRIDKNYCSASCRQLNHLQRKAVELFGVTVKEEHVKPSIDTSGENVKTVLPEIRKQEEQNPAIELKKEKEYKFMPSKFVDEVGTLYKTRSIKHTHNLFSNDKLINKNLEWVNVRLRCLIEAVLFISERKSITFMDLAELTNSFIHLIKSEHFKKLPDNYPFKHFTTDFKNKLKRICVENEGDEEVPLKLNRKLKIDLIVYRCELRDVVPKIKFSELTFKSNTDE